MVINVVGGFDLLIYAGFGMDGSRPIISDSRNERYTRKMQLYKRTRGSEALTRIEQQWVYLKGMMMNLKDVDVAMRHLPEANMLPPLISGVREEDGEEFRTRSCQSIWSAGAARGPLSAVLFLGHGFEVPWHIEALRICLWMKE